MKVKWWVYLLGVFVVFKIGNFDWNIFVYGGVEVDFLFNYKEKLFIDDDKEEKFNEWFSDCINLFMFFVFGGM